MQWTKKSPVGVVRSVWVVSCVFNPSHSWKVHHTHRALFCRLCYLTPHTPGKYTTPTGLFLSAFLLNPSLLESTPHPQRSFFLLSIHVFVLRSLFLITKYMVSR